MIFTSDNASGAAPEILQALIGAETGYAMPYGNDPVTARAQGLVREVFEAPDAAVHFVATGTAANALALACLCPPWATIFCHRGSHIEEDECCAPEFFTGGAKLTLLGGEDAKIGETELRAAIARTAPHGVHNAQAGALSLTQATEAGAAYSLDEVRRLAGIGARCRVAGAHGRHAAGQRAGADGRGTGRDDLEGRCRRALSRRDQERRHGGRGGDPVRPGESLGVRAAPQARRTSVLQDALHLGADGGLSHGRAVAAPGRACQRHGRPAGGRAERSGARAC